MKKHKMAFLVSALAFPVIVCSLFLSMGLMLKNKSWKPANKVFPIFGKYENGNHYRSAPMVKFSCDSLTIERAEYLNSITSTEVLKDAEMLIDTTKISLLYNKEKNSCKLDGNHMGLTCKFNRIPNIKLVKSNYHYNIDQMELASNTQLTLTNTRFNWYTDLKTSTSNSTLNKFASKAVYFHLSDSSILEMENLIEGLKYVIYLNNGSTLEILNQINTSKMNVEIYYDETCKMSVPTYYLKQAKLIGTVVSKINN